MKLRLAIGALAILGALACDRGDPALRPFEARLTGFAYAPVGTGLLRGSVPRNGQLYKQLMKRTRSGRPEDSALVALLDQNFGAASTLLEEARNAESAQSGTWSNLAAMFIELADKRTEPYDLLRALGAAERALALAPSLKEAAFNKALTLERLGLTVPAGKAWIRYLSIEREPDWRREAKVHLNSLTHPTEKAAWRASRVELEKSALRGDQVAVDRIVDRFRIRSRRFGEEDLLSIWSEARGKGHSLQASQTLVMARSLGRSLSTLSGDEMLWDAVDVIEKKQNDPDLVIGHRDYLLGVQAYDEHNISKAMLHFSAARESLLRAGSPVSLWASFFIAACEYQQSRYSESDALLEWVQAKISNRRYPILRGRIFWVRGLICLMQARYESALRDYRTALDIFKMTGEVDHIAALHYLIFEYFYFTGDLRLAWLELYEAMTLIDGISQDKFRQLILYGGTAVSLAMSEPQAALYFQDQAVLLAETSRDPVALVEGLRWRALIHLDAGHVDEARKDISAAKYHLQTITIEPVRLGLLGSMLLVEGRIRGAKNPQQELSLVREAIAIFRRTDYRLGLLRANLQEARALRACSDRRQAEEVLTESINELESQRKLVAEADRVEFWESSQALFDEMISLQINEFNQPALAFSYAERSKARMLLDLAVESTRKFSASTGQPITLENLQEALSEDVTLIDFSLSGKDLLIWAIRPEGVDLSRKKITERELAVRVESFRQAIQAKDRRRMEKLSSDISNLLLGEIPKGFLASKALVFIPDKVLHAFPFAALRDPGTGKFLVENHRIETAQSARIYTQCLESLRQRPIPADPRVLLVGNPTFDVHAFPTLGALKGAEREVSEIAGLYQHPDVLIGSAATKLAVISMARTADVLHIAAHAVLDSRRALLSKIVLADNQSIAEERVWTIREIYRAHLSRVRLAVLSGCSTADGVETSSEGLASLARAFMAAGVPTVVANLWQVNDQTQAKIAVELHRQLLLVKDPSEALHRVQTQMLFSTEGELRDPRAWAGLQLMGCGCKAY